MDSDKENELNKLRRAIEDQRIKAERVDVLGKPKTISETVYKFPTSSSNVHNSVISPSTENAYPVFVSPDHDHWSSSTSSVSGQLNSNSTLTRNNVDNLSPNSSINKRVSSGSLSSVSSHISGSSSSTGSSGPEIEAAMKQGKKKRWLPLKSAFSKGSKSQSSSQPDLLDSEDSGCPLSPTLGRRVTTHHNGSVGSSSESEAIQELLQIVQEKERKLTDVRLEALTSQHQIHQLREQITQMQHEMQLLRLENERLQAAANLGSTNSSSEERVYSPTHGSTKNYKSLHRPSSTNVLTSIGSLERTASRGGTCRSVSCTQSPVTSPFHRPHYSDQAPLSICSSMPPALDYCNLQNTLSPESESDGFQVKFVVTSSSTMLPGKRSVVIGSLPVPRRASWEELDRVTQSIFSEYCRVVDGDTRLGLSSDSIDHYDVGELKREIGGKVPALLPCAYIVGDVDTVEIKLKDASSGNVDQMAFDILISRETLDCYLSLLLQNRRIVLQGPSGTGKTAFAMSLAEYMVTRLRSEGGNTMVVVIDAKQEGEEKLQRYLADLSLRSKRVDSPSVPAVLIVENLHLMTSLANILEQLLSLSGNASKSPYIIGTMQPGDEKNLISNQDFRTILCGSGSAHAQRYLTRALRRSLVEHVLTAPQTRNGENGKLSSIVLWIPLCWQHINRFLEMQNLQYSVLGAKIFTKCPMNVAGSCSWFVGIWNQTIIPYLASELSTKPGNETSTWEDPAKWILNSFPWDTRETGIDPMRSLERLRPRKYDGKPLPKCPNENDTIDGDYDDVQLPPPPLPVRSTYSDSHISSFHSRPGSNRNNTYSCKQNGTVGSQSSCNNNSNSRVQNSPWHKGSASATQSPASNNQTRPHNNDPTVYNKLKTYRSESGKNSSKDPLKDMLAQLQHAALNPNEDY